MSNTSGYGLPRKKATYMVAIDGSPSAEQAFQFAVDHTDKSDHIIVCLSFLICANELIYKPRLSLELRRNLSISLQTLSTILLNLQRKEN